MLELVTFRLIGSTFRPKCQTAVPLMLRLVLQPPVILSGIVRDYFGLGLRFENKLPRVWLALAIFFVFLFSPWKYFFKFRS